MVRTYIFVVLLGTPLSLWADQSPLVSTDTTPTPAISTVTAPTPPAPSTSTAQTPTASTETMPTSSMPVPPGTPLTPVVEVPRAAPAPSRPGFNDMSGTLGSLDADARIIRLSVEGGYNVEFSYDSQTTVSGEGHSLAIADLGYGDQVTIRYKGKDLIAREIVQTHKMPSTMPTAPPEPQSLPPPVEPEPPPLQ